MGLYKRKGIWYIQYFDRGRRIRESSGSTKKTVARELLNRRRNEIAEGKTPGVYFKKATFEDLKDLYLSDYKINRKKTLARAEQHANNLKEHFGGLPANRITTAQMNVFIAMRQQQKATNATINRELAALRRMFNLAVRAGKVERIPHIPRLNESSPRKGFFEHHEFTALRDALPEHLRGFVTFAYRTGWRREEIAGLRWNQVDRRRGIVRLEPGESKSGQARTLYLDEELQAVIADQWEKRKASGRLLPYVFTNERGRARLKDFRKTWAAACKKAKIGTDRLFHDLRRTAIRNMIRAGIPERVAMEISGHKTRSVFDRYNIVSDTDLREAAAKHSKYLSDA